MTKFILDFVNVKKNIIHVVSPKGIGISINIDYSGVDNITAASEIGTILDILNDNVEEIKEITNENVR